MTNIANNRSFSIFVMFLIAFMISCKAVHQSKIENSLLIYDGTEVADHIAPAVVKLQTSNGGLCSGAIIGPHTVVTAAHCRWTEFGKPLTLSLQGMSARSYYPHPEFRNWSEQHKGLRNERFNPYDIMFLAFNQDLIKELGGIKPISIRPFPLAKGRIKAKVFGYGAVRETVDRQGRITDTGFGKKRYGYVTIERIGDHLVTLATEGNYGMMVNGDSGGPVLDENGDLIGIHSTTSNDARTQTISAAALYIDTKVIRNLAAQAHRCGQSNGLCIDDVFNSRNKISAVEGEINLPGIHAMAKARKCGDVIIGWNERQVQILDQDKGIPVYNSTSGEDVRAVACKDDLVAILGRNNIVVFRINPTQKVDVLPLQGLTDKAVGIAFLENGFWVLGEHALYSLQRGVSQVKKVFAFPAYVTLTGLASTDNKLIPYSKSAIFEQQGGTSFEMRPVYFHIQDLAVYGNQVFIATPNTLLRRRAGDSDFQKIANAPLTHQLMSVADGELKVLSLGKIWRLSSEY